MIGILFLAFWEFGVRHFGVSKFVLPPPSSIAEALVEDFGSLSQSLWNTLRVTLEAFFTALILGVLFAVLFARSKLLEMSLFPYAVILQVTPVVSIAPLIIIWVGFDHLERALLILATIVAFFPILSNTTMGLKSADHNLRNLFDLYHASSWQRLIELEFPSALPYLLAGVKVSGGLALDRGGGRGVRRRLRFGNRTRLAHHRIGQSPQYPANVRGVAPAVASWRIDLFLADRNRESAAEALARERCPTGELAS